jgi:predicted MFS family arabinose efflux permease
MALITNAVEARYRGGFMSVNSAVQQAANSLASTAAGLFLSRGPNGELLGYPAVGLLSAAGMLLTVLMAVRLKQIAPQAAAPHAAHPVREASGE